MAGHGWNALADRVEPWLQAVLPRHCGGCQRVGHSWCAMCSAAVRSLRGGLVPAPLGAPGILAVSGEHVELLRAAVLLHKSRHHAGVYADLIYLAARCLAAVRRVLPVVVGADTIRLEPLVLIPVPPSSPSAWRSPAGELAVGLAASSDEVRCVHLLCARRRKHAQKSLDAAGRARNVVGAFEARPPRGDHGGLAVLIDDVVTTGATLAQARAVAEASGYRVPAAIAITRTPGSGP